MGKGSRTGGKSSPYDYAPPVDDSPGAEPDPLLTEVGDGGLNPTTVALICARVEIGVPVPTACVASGCSVSKLNHWLTIARTERARGSVSGGFADGESPHLYILERIERAKATFEAQMVAAVRAAAPLDWKAAAYLLEKRAAKRWHEKTVMSIQVDKTNSIEITSMSTEKLIAIARGLLPEEDVKVVKALPANVTEGELVDDDMDKAD